MTEFSDDQLEIGFIKLQLYDRLMNTSYRVLQLFAAILEDYNDAERLLPPELRIDMESISDEVRDIFASENKVQDRMDEEMLKSSFSDEPLN
tara:strand:- start:1032 stop:1307 length:276 start_codon:yes stop_codon:yes gene_type:complete